MDDGAYFPTPNDASAGEPSIEARQLHFAIGHSVRNSWAVWLIVFFMGLTIRGHATSFYPYAWLFAVGIAYHARAIYLKAGLQLEAVSRQTERWRRRYLYSILCCGTLLALGPPLFFPSLPEISRAYITMVMCCWLAGAMAGLGPVPGTFVRYVAVTVSGLVAGWLMVGTSLYALDTVAMLLMYAVIVSAFANRLARIVNESLRIRDANEVLLRDLRLAKEQAEDSSSAKSRFLAVASHDLRQPLHALILLNGLLARRQSAERTAEISAQMGRSLATLERLFSSILDLSKLDAATISPRERWVSLTPVVERLLSEFGTAAQAKQVKLIAEVPTIDLYTDQDLLERILRNLLENALKFTPQGEIVVAASMVPEGCVISVADSGVGVPANLREEIFKEYFQVQSPGHSGGLGLGLAIVKRLCYLIGISIRVKDNVPRGARFELALPFERVRPEEPGGAPTTLDVSDDVSLVGYRVLCVDDDPDSLQALRALLTDWGCEVLTAHSPQAALEACRESIGIDALLADYALNAEMNGEQLLHALRDLLGPLPGALLTGDSTAAQAQKVGLIEFPLLTKPVSPVELKKILEVFKEIE